MQEFGDEFIIESYKVPWLIWIQLVITVLLIILLLFGFSIFASDPSSSSSASSPPTTTAAAPPTNLSRPGTSRGRIKVEDQRLRRDGEISAVGEEDQTGEESTSVKDPTFFRQSTHPCNFFEQAKLVFLKCFGFDSTSSEHQHEKEE